jgi:hypothetical protein
VAASLLSGAPSLLLALWRDGPSGAWRYGVSATRSIGVLIPPGRPGIVRGAAAHFAISAAVGEALGRLVPSRHSMMWAAAGGAGVGIVGVGIIGRRLPGIRDLPLGPQLADNVAFGIIFAAVADRGRTAPGY